jgi:hypothetical protein
MALSLVGSFCRRATIRTPSSLKVATRNSSSLSWRPHNHEVPRHPAKKHHRAHIARFTWSSKPLVRVLDGSTASWIASMFAVLHTRACIAMHTACCTSCAGGRAFIIPAISPRQTLPNQPCSITCASSPAGNLRLLLLPSTIASLLQIVPFATSFLTLPVRWRTDFINPFCIAGQWA